MANKNPHRKVGTGTGAHKLTEAIPGRNRFAPGHYECSCGKDFTGMNKWEQHRYDENRNAKRRGRNDG